jgi:hypothetical protein
MSVRCFFGGRHYECRPLCQIILDPVDRLPRKRCGPGDFANARGFPQHRLGALELLAAGGPERAESEQIIGGRIAASLHGKRGQANGALLDNGILLRLLSPEAQSKPCCNRSGR